MKTVFNLDSLDGIYESFAHNGYVRIRNVISGVLVEALRLEIEKVKQTAQRLPEGLVWFSPSTTGGLVIQRINRINEYSPLIDQVGHSHSDLVQISVRLLNVNNVRFADGSEGSEGAVLVVKDPNNASEYGALRWHRDGKFTQHLPINPFINVGIYLDESTSNMGALVVLPGSHHNNLFDESLEETTRFHPDEICVEAQIGDLVIHSHQILHRSGHFKLSNGHRKVLYFNYYPSSS